MKKWGDVLSGTGAVVVSLLSCAACPLCIPIYAGFLSLIGIEIINIHDLFLPLMILFSLLTLGFMAYQINRHHGVWKPFQFAMAAGLGMIGAAVFDYKYLLYACLALFMGSVIWSKKTLIHKGHGCC